MEAALFTLDVAMLILLLLAVSRADKNPDKSSRTLGFFSYLEHKGDEVQKGLGGTKDKRRA